LSARQVLDSELHVLSRSQATFRIFRIARQEYPGKPALDETLEERLRTLLDDPLQYGIQLFDALLPPDSKLLAGYESALSLATRQKRPLRFRLFLDPSLAAGLHELRWERLHDVRRDISLARSPNVLLSRYLGLADPPGPPVAGTPRLLVAISNPTDLSSLGLPPIDVAQAREAIAEALAPLARKISAEFLDGPVTPARLRDRLIGGGFHVLHLLAHGILPAGGGPAHLVLEKPDETGEGSVAEPVDEGLLAEILEADPNLRLVMLLACHGGALSTSDPFSGLALQMVNRGLPAVVAMRQAVSLPTAKTFSHRFYVNLARTRSVERAVNEARHQLYLLQKDGDEWAIPILFQRLEGDLLWEPARPSWKTVLAAVAVALLLASLAAWLFLRPRGAPTIVVSSFTNASHRPEDAWVSTALGDMLTAALLAGDRREARIVDRDAVSEAETDFALAGKTGTSADFHRRLGADWVVGGSFNRRSSTSELFTVEVTLTRSTAPGEPIPFKKQGSLGGLAKVVSQVADQIRSELELGAASRQQKIDLQALFPTSKPALALYFDGVTSLRRFNSSAAFESLRKAQREDPENPLIYRRLASAAWDLNDEDGARRWAEQARQRSSKLPRLESLEIDLMGLKLARRQDAVIEKLRALEPEDYRYRFELAEEEDPADALETLDGLLEERSPDHVQARALYLKANVKDDLGESDEALDLVEQAVEKARAVGATYLMAAAQLLRSHVLTRLGRYTSALSDLDAAQRIFRNARDRIYENVCAEQRAVIEFHLGSRPLPEIRKDLRKLEEAYRAEGADEDRARVLVLESMILSDQGSPREAEAKRQEARSLVGEQQDTWASSLVEQAFALVVRGEKFAKVNEIAEQLEGLESSSRTATALSSLAELYYYHGRLQDAKHWQSAALEGHSGSLAAYDRYRLGMILAAQGNPDGRDQVLEVYELQAEMAESAYRAESALGLARLENLEGNFTRGADLAEAAEKVLEPAGRSDLVALAQATRAWALACEGDKVTAQEALAKAQRHSRESEDFRVAFETGIAAARFQAIADRKGADSIRALEGIINDTRRRGLKLYELDARLALGEIKLALGLGGQQDLNSLRNDASKEGFKQIDTLAARALKEGPACHGRPTSLRDRWSRWLAQILS
jgi:tetratricopeptide (TPR) repeat protein/TolB-like protein